MAEILTVVGIDPSLRNTGIAYRANNCIFMASRIDPGKLSGMPRVAKIRDAIDTYVESCCPDLVVIEGYALGFRGASNTVFGLGELGGVIKLFLLDKGIDILVVPPTSLKLFATGKGNATKDDVKLALQEQTGVSFPTSDQNDATWLMLMGEAKLDSRLIPRTRTHHKRKAMLGCSLITGF